MSAHARPASCLLALGFFPSAPIRPSFAFELSMMDFAHQLYLRSPPNRTAWASTLDYILRQRGYTLRGSDPIHRRFAKAARYYSLLLAHTETHLRQKVVSASSDVINGDEGGEERDWVEESSFPDEEYLVKCCQLCFGAVAEHDDWAP